MPFVYVRSTIQFANMVAEFVAAKVRAELRHQGVAIMASVEALESAIQQQWETVSPAITEVQNKLRDLTDLINTGATSEQLNALVAEVNNNTSRIAEGLRTEMEDPETPDPTVPLPEVENPLPESVENNEPNA